jgi:hypothetical protein
MNVEEIKARRASIVFWASLDDTPMMPAGKNDPAYGSKAHRFIAHAPADIAFLLEKLDEAQERIKDREEQLDIAHRWRKEEEAKVTTLEASNKKMREALRSIAHQAPHGVDFGIWAEKIANEALADHDG